MTFAKRNALLAVHVGMYTPHRGVAGVVTQLCIKKRMNRINQRPILGGKIDPGTFGQFTVGEFDLTRTRILQFGQTGHLLTVDLRRAGKITLGKLGGNGGQVFAN